MMRMNLWYTPVLWQLLSALYPLPSTFSLVLLPRGSYSTLSVPQHMALLATCSCCTRQYRTMFFKWAPNKLSPGARLSVIALEHSYWHRSWHFYTASPLCGTGMPTLARDCSWISTRAQKKVLLHSPTGREGVGLICSLSPCTLQGSCSIAPFRFCMFLPRSPAHRKTAFTFPHFLLLLKEAFNPPSLLDHAWQKFEYLLKIGDNEQKQEDRLWRKSRPGGRFIYANPLQNVLSQLGWSCLHKMSQP